MRCASGSRRTRTRRAGSWPRPAMSFPTGPSPGGSRPIRSTSWSSTTNSHAPGSADRATPSGSVGRHPRSSSRALPNNTSDISRRSSAARSSGVSCSPSPTPAPTWRTWGHARSATVTSTSSTARRSGRAVPTTRSSASSSPAPTPTQPKHKGISYFICPMDLPGITMSPIVDMTTAPLVQPGVLRRRAHPGIAARGGGR